jgi:hypothetical protein
MKAARTSETLVYFHKTTQLYIPESYHIQVRCVSTSSHLQYHSVGNTTVNAMDSVNVPIIDGKLQVLTLAGVALCRLLLWPAFRVTRD